MNCRNCNNPPNGNFCSNCGNPVQLKRVDSHYILHEIQHILHFEKGILYTVKELLIRPGQTIAEFISHNRSRIVKPIVFIIVTSFIYTIINHFFHIEKEYIDFTATNESAISLILSWIQDHYGYANILMGAFIAFWLKLFFRKYDYNFFEILILLCFVMGMGMLIFAVFALLEGLAKVSVMGIAGIIGFGYTTWAIGQFFNKNKISSYIKALLSYLLGNIAFFILVILLGILIDSFIKH